MGLWDLVNHKTWGFLSRETFEVKNMQTWGFSAAKRKFWAKIRFEQGFWANLPSKQYWYFPKCPADWVSAANHGDLPSDRDAVTCQEYLESFSPAMFELTQYEIFALWTKKGNFMGTVHPNKIEQTACFFFSVFSRMKLRSGSKQTTVTAWKVYCRWFYICHWSWTSGVPLGQTAKNTW